MESAGYQYSAKGGSSIHSHGLVSRVMVCSYGEASAADLSALSATLLFRSEVESTTTDLEVPPGQAG
ncbi:MAG: hypothetical protein JRM77_09750 [Nitrososphaerota archaeon]|nr:hypothetical protein [Nitrososphaerota archaeon]